MIQIFENPLDFLMKLKQYNVSLIHNQGGGFHFECFDRIEAVAVKGFLCGCNSSQEI